MPHDPRAVLQAANAAILKGDYEGFLAHCTEDTVWIFVGEQRINGKEAVRQWMATAYQEPPRFEVHRMIAGDDHVTALGEITLKDGKGQPRRHAYCDVWRLREGRLAELHAFVIEAPLDGH